jgi:hypothetical protein
MTGSKMMADMMHEMMYDECQIIARAIAKG